MKSKEEVKNKVCKERQCYYVHTDEDCYIHLQGQTRTSRDSMDRQGQVGASKDRQGMSLFVPACPCLSLLVPVCPCLVPACPWAVLSIDWHNW